jgi:hypothetical protein
LLPVGHWLLISIFCKNTYFSKLKGTGMNLLNKNQLFINLDSSLVQICRIKFQTMIHNKKALLFLAIMAIIQLKGQSQSFPYAQTPDWESTPGGYISTGLGLADIDNDGWKDIIVANGNDILRQHLVVYYNNGDGTFPLLPDWQSDDIDYHGHLSAGDIDLDGWIDVAVSVYIGPAGFGDPGKVKVYYNQGGELEGTPSFESYSYYTFSCALGDADADGDLDLATTGGEPYSALYDEGKIFFNRNGTFSENPEWTSAIPFGSLDVDFANVDMNGFLDVIFTSEDTPNYVFLADNTGNITTDPSWSSAENSNFINSVDFGFIGEFKHPGFVMTGNSQLGGDGKVRLYTFPNAVPATSSANWTSNPFGYGSGILLSDVDLDGLPDLIYGGWWLPVNIHLAQNSVFDINPEYTSATNSVVEAIQIADLDRDEIISATQTFNISGNDISILFLEKQMVENILSVQINGYEINPAFYCFVPNKNWISIKDNLRNGDVVSIEYEYSNDGDMVITNWDGSKGNYIFYYDAATKIATSWDDNNRIDISISPNPAHNDFAVTIEISEKTLIEMTITDLTGRKIYLADRKWVEPGQNSLRFRDLGLTKGVYSIIMKTGSISEVRKLVVY